MPPDSADEGPQLVGVEVLADSAIGDHAAVEDDQDSIGIGEDFVEIGRGENDRRALAPSFQQAGPDVGRRIQVEPLVGCSITSRAEFGRKQGEQQPLLVAARKLVDRRSGAPLIRKVSMLAWARLRA